MTRPPESFLSRELAKKSFPNILLVVEFKTDRMVPADPAGIRPGYLRQLALYRKALQGLFPGRAVSCGILWTVAPRLMEVPAALVDGCERVLDPAGAGS